MNKPSPQLLTLFLVGFALSACNHDKPQAGVSVAVTKTAPAGSATTPVPATAAPEPAVPTANAAAALMSASGSKVSGTVSFIETPAGGVRIVADISGLSPGVHGIHVHEKGDCSAPDAASAGGHFNPDGVKHGAPIGASHHAGDLGNLTADASGHALLDTVVKGITLTGPNSIVGKGLIVHAGADDLKSQPSGNAGTRVACGIIEAAASPTA